MRSFVYKVTYLAIFPIYQPIDSCCFLFGINQHIIGHTLALVEFKFQLFARLALAVDGEITAKISSGALVIFSSGSQHMTSTSDLTIVSVDMLQSIPYRASHCL